MENRRPLSPASDTPRFGTPRRRFTSPTNSVPPPPSTPTRISSSHISSPRSNSRPQTPTSRPLSPPSTPASSEKEKDGNIEILFSHPAAKVVNLTVSPNALKQPDLPWRGAEERTIASGPLRIYRTLPQEVAFLQSGSALRPLLKRTQCWNVDGNRIFCLQLRPGNYWRIEIWGPEEEQPAQIEKFKETMTSIIAYEMTACPFIRAAECEPLVEHPELMAPARVWSRAHLRRISDTPTPPIEGFSFLDVRSSEPAYDTRSVKSGGDEFERPKRNFDSQDERDCKSDYSSGSTTGSSLVSQRVKLLEACNELEEPMDLSTGRKWQKPMAPEDDTTEDTDKAKALPHAVAAAARERALRRRSTAVGDCIIPPVLDTPSPAPSRRPSSTAPPPPQFGPINKWLDFTPPVSPLGGARPDTVVSVINSSLPASPTALLSERSQTTEPLTHLELTPTDIEDDEETSSTPSLASESGTSSSASSDSINSFDFPITYRPSPHLLVDPCFHPPLRRNTAASLGLPQKAHEPATNASYVVLKPNTFIVSRMVEIATRLDATSGGITGASFMVNQQGEVKWRDEVDPLEGWGLEVPPGTPLELGSVGEGLWVAREEERDVDH